LDAAKAVKLAKAGKSVSKISSGGYERAISISASGFDGAIALLPRLQWYSVIF